MTISQVKRLHSADTFKRPSRNGHDISGFRMFQVVSVDLHDVTVCDEHGYSTRLLFNQPCTKEFFKFAEAVTQQQ